MNQLPHDLKPAPRHWWAAAGLLVLVTAAVYWPVATHEFINYDDPLYVTENGLVNAGLTPQGILWAFTRIAGEETYWHPLTWLSHMLDCQLFGLKAGAHHLVNLLFHAANVVLLFALFHRMTGSVWRSGLAAALFALHPLQVDTVAWVAERKNLLSTLFGLLTLLAYARYARRPSVWRYVWVVGWFALGLMAKPSLVTLPCVLLLLDYWPLGRISNRDLRLPSSHPLPQFPVRRLLWEKVPLFILTAGSSVITILAHERLNLVVSAEEFPWSSRLAHAAVSYVQYLGKVIWPSHLAVCYPPPAPWPAAQVGAAGLVLAGISALALCQARRRPYLLVGWLWFLGTLVPAIGLVQVGTQSMADRFAYVAVIGLFIMVTWGISEAAAGGRGRQIMLRTAAAAALTGCAATAWFQLKHWRNSETLFRHAIAVTADSAIAHHNLGHALIRQRKYDEAIAHFAEANRIDPRYAQTQFNWGNVLSVQGKFDEAVAHYVQALNLKPDYAQVHCNWAKALVLQGKLAEAETHFLEALRLKPEYVEARIDLGNLLLLQGRIGEAVSQFREALSINPRNAEGHYYFAGALARLKRVSEAVTHFQAALNVKPDYAAAANDLAWILATETNAAIRNAQEAVHCAERACALTTNQVAIYLDTLGVAYSETGRFPEAVAAAERAAARARATGEQRLAARIQSQVEPYRQGRAYHLISEGTGP